MNYRYTTPNNAMKGIEYLILRFGLFLFFALITSPVAIIAGVMIECLDAYEHLRILRWVFLAILLAWLFGLPWLVNRAAQHMTFENQKLGDAMKGAFYDLRLRLAFLPVIGHWFNFKSRDDDDHNAS
jgi:hypothetical protein